MENSIKNWGKQNFRGHNLIFVIFLISVIILISYLFVSEVVWNVNDMRPLSFSQFLMADKLFGAAGDAAVPNTTGLTLTTLRLLSNLKLDLKIFSSQKFLDLVNYVKTPLVVGEKGRTNPFESY